MEPAEKPCKQATGEKDLKFPHCMTWWQMLALRQGQGLRVGGTEPQYPGSTLPQGPESGLSPRSASTIHRTYFIGATGFPCRDLLCSGVM